MRTEVQDQDVRELARAVGRLAMLLAGEPRPALGPDHWLAVRELAHLTGRSKSGVRRWIKEHGLPAKQLPGGGYLVRYGDFLQWNDGDDEVAILDRAIRSLDRSGG